MGEFVYFPQQFSFKKITPRIGKIVYENIANSQDKPIKSLFLGPFYKEKFQNENC
jgi:hypothetical protein